MSQLPGSGGSRRDLRSYARPAAGVAVLLAAAGLVGSSGAASWALNGVESLGFSTEAHASHSIIHDEITIKPSGPSAPIRSALGPPAPAQAASTRTTDSADGSALTAVLTTLMNEIDQALTAAVQPATTPQAAVAPSGLDAVVVRAVVHVTVAASAPTVQAMTGQPAMKRDDAGAGDDRSAEPPAANNAVADRDQQAHTQPAPVNAAVSGSFAVRQAPPVQVPPQASAPRVVVIVSSPPQTAAPDDDRDDQTQAPPPPAHHEPPEQATIPPPPPPPPPPQATRPPQAANPPSTIPAACDPSRRNADPHCGQNQPPADNGDNGHGSGSGQSGPGGGNSQGNGNGGQGGDHGPAGGNGPGGGSGPGGGQGQGGGNGHGGGGGRH